MNEDEKTILNCMAWNKKILEEDMDEKEKNETLKWVELMGAVNLVVKEIKESPEFFERFMREVWCELQNRDSSVEW